uniref:Large ribosomal subunit protein bL19c n=1 Tax=Cyanophora paradoxa TaxID=2762 RepID=RK19_CYAPA|nr:ribosomal protein L19 [Cyanophora paradoxa]P48127.1 RecName: Full=Large ribosomal subunit protein bL19c; AltName: Full=50S ribosomal protein L19, cyanelle [Cyanophora paradoxa]AAA81187.1 ribosomal protein L19 [Cyanophora paradoxa]
MHTQQLISQIESQYLKDNLPEICVGDTVKVGVLIQEEDNKNSGEKERIQFYEGVVISLSKLKNINGTIRVRRILQGIGIERTFLVHSPLIKSINIIRRSKVRRAKLYYLRTLTGKATRLKQRLIKHYRLIY